MYKIIAVDLDGTMLNKYGTVTEETKQTIKQTIEQGTDVIIASGRPIDSIKTIAKEIESNNYFIAGNGALIYDIKKDKIIYEKFLSKSKVLEIAKICEENSISYNIYTEETIIAKQLKHNVLYYYKENLKKEEKDKTNITIVEDIIEYIKNSNNEKYLKDKENYWLLTTKLKGCNIVNVNKCNEQWFFKMGEIIARLHLAFDECEGKIKCWNNSLLGEMESWIRKNIYEYDKKIIDKNEFEDIIKELRLVDKDLSYGLIHRDVHLGNFLFYNNEFSGYVDFDLSQKNIRIFDLCYFMLGLLLEDEENKVDETQWFQYLKNLVKGYASVIPISIIERKSIPLVMECIELLFVAYFIGEKDERAMRDSLKLYEFCKDNCNKIKASVQL